MTFDRARAEAALKDYDAIPDYTRNQLLDRLESYTNPERQRVAAHAPDTTPVVGDLRATIRLLQRRLNVIEHLCDEADTIRTPVLPVTTIRAALRTGDER